MMYAFIETSVLEMGVPEDRLISTRLTGFALVCSVWGTEWVAQSSWEDE